MKKRALLTMLCAALTLTTFASCNSETETTTTEEIEKVDVMTATPEEYTLPLTEEPVTLSISIIESWTPEYSLADNREIFQAIEEDTGVTLDWQVTPDSDYDTVLKTKIAGGEIADITYIKSSTNPIQLYEDGLTIDHGAYIAKYAPNILRIMKDEIDVRAQMMGPDGNVYVGIVDHNYRTANVKGIYYRNDWRIALGIDEPETLDDYYEMFKAFAEQDPNGNGEQDEVALYPTGVASLGPIAAAFGLDFQNNAGDNDGFSMVTGQLEYQYIRPEFKDFLKYIKSYYDAGIIPQEVWGTGDSEKTLLSNNRLGAYSNGLGQCDTYDNVLLQAGFIDEITPETGYNWLQPPMNEDGQRISPALPYVQTNAFVVSKKCEHPDIAIKWLDYVWGTEAGQRYTQYGIEGKSYTVEDGVPVFTDYILNNPDGLGVHPALRTLGAFTPGLTYWTDEGFSAQWVNNEKLSQVISDAQETMVWEPFPKILGTPEETSEIASKMVEITTYRDEMILKFIMGQASIDDEFDTYVQTMKDLGIDDVVAMKQAQYDALMSE